MNEDVIRLMIEREQRNRLAQKISVWELANGITFTPMKRDFTQPRIQQLVDDAMKERKYERREHCT